MNNGLTNKSLHKRPTAAITSAKYCRFAFLFLFTLISSACIQTPPQINRTTNGAIVIEGGSDGMSDTVRYILSKAETRNAIGILNSTGGRGGHLMCGSTHKVFEIDSLYRANWIASANVRCSTLQVRDSFYRGTHQIRDLIGLSKVGKIQVDTIKDSLDLKKWITNKANDSTFIGYITDGKVLYNVTAYLPLYHNQGKTWRAFTRKYDSAGQGKIDSYGFMICDSTTNNKDEIAICNIATRNEIEILDSLQIRHADIKLGLIIKSYSIIQ